VAKDDYKIIIEDHKLYIGFEEDCYMFEVQNEAVSQCSVPELKCRRSRHTYG